MIRPDNQQLRLTLYLKNYDQISFNFFFTDFLCQQCVPIQPLFYLYSLPQIIFYLTLCIMKVLFECFAHGLCILKVALFLHFNSDRDD